MACVTPGVFLIVRFPVHARVSTSSVDSMLVLPGCGGHATGAARV